MRRGMAVALAALLFVAVACSDGDGEATSITAGTVSTSTTTAPDVTETTGVKPDLEVPAELTVESLAWEGTVFVSSREPATNAQTRATGSVSGTYSSPNSHSIRFRADTITIDPDTDSVGREGVIWSGTAIGDTIWYSEDEGEYQVGSRAAGDAAEYFEILSTAGGAILPTQELLDDLRGRDWEFVDAAGVPAMRFRLSGVSVHEYGGLFGEVLIGDLPPGVETADITIVIDPTSGIAIGGKLEASADTAGTLYEVVFTFSITDLNTARVFPPGVEAFDVPEGFVPYADAEGRFRIAVPAEWAAEDDGRDSVVFPSPDDPDHFAGVLFEEGSEAANAGEYLDGLIAEENDESVVILERTTTEFLDLMWERVEVIYDADGPYHGVAWVALVEDTIVVIQYAAPDDLWESEQQAAEALFASFGFLEQGS